MSKTDYAAAKWIGAHEGNFEVGRRGHKPTAIVVHVMAGTLYGTDTWFNTKRSPGSSANYGIGLTWANRNNPTAPLSVHQYVRETDTSFHAGEVRGATWSGLRPGVNPNRYTIGIEHAGTADSEWSDALYLESAKLIADICFRWDIPVDRDHIIGHREIDSVRRAGCPGKCDFFRLLDMTRLRLAFLRRS